MLSWLLLSMALAAPLPFTVHAGELAEIQKNIAVDRLPAEARSAIQRIRQGGPFPYAKDGAVFGNRERRLPPRPRDWYREYTVASPDARHRGADRGKLRIVAGREGEYYYSNDHYRTFRRVTGHAAP